MFLFIAFIIFRAYIINTTNVAKIIIESFEDTYSQRHVAQYNDIYFYYDNKCLYKDENGVKSLILKDIQDISAIAVDETKIYIGQYDKIKVLDYKGDISIEKEGFADISQLYVDMQYLYILDDRKIVLLDKKDMKKINRFNAIKDSKIIKTKYEKEVFYIEDIKNSKDTFIVGFSVLRDRVNSEVVTYENYVNDTGIYESLIRSDDNAVVIGNKGRQFWYFHNELYTITYGWPLNLERYTLNNNRQEEVINFAENITFKENNSRIEDNELILIGQYNHNNQYGYKHLIYKLLSEEPLYDGQHGLEIFCDSELLYHSFDSIYIYDLLNDELSCQHKTNSGERIIYADGKKAITYYNHMLNTYSLKDWTLQKQEQADYIENQGSYYFELCGNKIFVYNEQDKLLNIIKV